MAVVDSVKLNSLRDKLAKNAEENERLKAAIVKEEQRLREKEKRDTEKWWRELSRTMEQLFLMRFGTDYKEAVDKGRIITIIEADLGMGAAQAETGDGLEAEREEAEEDQLGESGDGGWEDPVL